MKIVFNRQGKKHVCSTCFRPFDWSANSWRFGRMEYETISQQRKEEKVFCSDGCKRRYLRKIKHYEIRNKYRSKKDY